MSIMEIISEDLSLAAIIDLYNKRLIHIYSLLMTMRQENQAYNAQTMRIRDPPKDVSIISLLPGRLILN